MPKRKNSFRHPTPEAQGDDSWVEVTLPTIKEIREIIQQTGKDLETFDTSQRLIQAHVHAWNWVDDEGAAMPPPKENPDVISELTTAEYKVLVGLLIGSEAEQKNA